MAAAGKAKPRRKGRAASAPDVEADRALCLRMFRTMALQRAVEDRMVTMYRQGEMLGSVFTGHWHEGIAVGAAAAIRPDDYLCPIHRDMGAHLWRGMPVAQILDSFLGKEPGTTHGRDGTLHYGRHDLRIYNLPSHVPDNYPVATGAALAFKYRGEDRLALAYCGDGATGNGNFHEALNIAAVMDLPCIFIVENNQYAYSTPLRLTTRGEIVDKAVGYGMPGVKVDGTDVLAVYRATATAAVRARAGQGPTLIEAVTMRMHGHAEHDPFDYVPRELLAAWAKRDPVELFAKKLRELGHAAAADIAAIREDAHRQALEARRKALAGPLPDPAGVEEGVYAD
ncbi:MAG TPA: thiamine pyrophosphate-dependent dehydrogenase E1 component subunit alpha [Nevskiaceae bacterium]